MSYEQVLGFFGMTVFGFIWIFIVNFNTRLLASRRDFVVPAMWSIVVSITYLVFIRTITLTDDWTILAGYPLGGSIATGIVTRFIPLRWKNDKDRKESSDAS